MLPSPCAAGAVLAAMLGHGALLEAQDWRHVHGLRQSSSPAVFDSTRARVVTVDDLGQTWEWDDVRWLRRPIPALPTPPVQMAYDSDRHVTVALVASGLQLATWEYDGAVWLQRVTAVAPPSRVFCGMAFDSLRHRTVLFGGYLFTSLNDTWEWDGIAWQQRTPLVAPAPRDGIGLAFDAARGVVVLFGGNPAFPILTPYQDTWQWDGTNWSQQTPSVAPPGRSGHSLAYDAVGQRTVMFGGGSGPGTTWSYDGTTWTPAAGAQPPSRPYCGLVFDDVRQRTVMFGGNTVGLSPAPWEWDGTTWTPRTIPDRPAPVTAPAFAHSLTRQRTVLFGGSAAGSSASAQTWEWDGRAWLLRQLPSSPPGRFRHLMWSDTSDVWVFGGFAANLTLTNDTWRYDGTTWTPVASAAAPSPRRFAAAAYDPAGGGQLLHGGENGSGTVLGDTWVLRGQGWQQLTVSPNPGLRDGAAMATDLLRQRVVLFGGFGPGATALDDTWEWDGTAWLAANPTVRPLPTGVYSMAYEPTLGFTVLVARTSNTDARAQVWLWNGANWLPYATSTTLQQPPDSWAVGAAGSVGLFDGRHQFELNLISPNVAEYGLGCGSPVPRLVADTWPRTAVPEFGLSTFAHPANALLAFTLGDQAANVPFGSCTLLTQVGGAVALGLANADGAGGLPVPVPAVASMVGARFYCQVVSWSAIGMAATAGLQLTIGA